MEIVLNKYEANFIPKECFFGFLRQEIYFAYSHEVDDIIKTVRSMSADGSVSIYLIEGPRLHQQRFIKEVESYVDENKTLFKAKELARARAKFDNLIDNNSQSA